MLPILLLLLAQSPLVAATVESVSLDFLALSADGSPVLDLKPEDITLKVDGRERALHSLRLVQITAAEAARSSAPAEPLPAPFGSNVSPADAGRSVIIVLEDESIRPGEEQRTRDEVKQFLARLAARDQVALVTVPHGGVKVNLTSDHARISETLSQIVGQAPRRQTASDAACRTRRTLHSLVGLLDGLVGGESPATVVFLSAGLMGPTRDAPALGPPGPCEIRPETFEEVASAASATRAQFYVIQPEEVMVEPGAVEIGFVGSGNLRIGLESLAGVTGGRLLRLGGGESPLIRVARETSAYYLLAFAPDAGERNGASHRVDLRTTRADVVLRARPAVTIAKADARRVRPAAITPRNMLREATVHRDLPLRAIGYVSKNSGDNRIKIVAAFESSDPSVTLASAAAGLFDAKGRLAAQWTANKEDLSQTPVIAALVVPAGTYRLRAAAVDASGRAGTADSEVAAELTAAGPLTLSAIVLGVSRGGFVPRLQFGDERVAIGYLEIFGLPRGASANVTFELAATVNGPALVSVPGALTPTEADDRRIATGHIPIAALPEGDFIVRAVVGMQGQPAGRALRTLRKSVP